MNRHHLPPPDPPARPDEQRRWDANLLTAIGCVLVLVGTVAVWLIMTHT